MVAYFLPRVIGRGSFCSEFCTFCKRSIKNLGRPYGNELQLSSLEASDKGVNYDFSVSC